MGVIMSRVEISIDASPITVTYADTSYMMSVLNKNKPWFYTHYTQLYYETGFTFYTRGYDMCPLITCELYSWEEGRDKKNLIAILKEKLDEGYCIVIELNQFYIPNGPTYMEYDCEHSSMIYGYDDEREIFQLMGFNRRRNYESSIVSYNDVLRAFCSLKENKQMPLRFLKYKSDVNYQIDWRKIEYDFAAYIDGGAKERLYRMDGRLYGIDVMGKMKEELRRLINKEVTSTDPRPLSFIQDHKTIMLKKIEYFASLGMKFLHNDVIEKYAQIRNLSLICMRMFIKYESTKDKNILDRIINYLNDIEHKERMIYPIVSKAISQYLTDISWDKEIGFNGD